MIDLRKNPSTRRVFNIWFKQQFFRKVQSVVDLKFLTKLQNKSGMWPTS